MMVDDDKANEISLLLQAKSYEKLWAEKARRELLKKIMDEWVVRVVMPCLL